LLARPRPELCRQRVVARGRLNASKGLWIASVPRLYAGARACVGAPMERFFQLLDVAQLRDQSLVERSPTTRKTIMDLLVAEVSRLGRDQEHLDSTERFIRECKDYIEHQQSIVQHLEANGYDATGAQGLLEGLQVFLDLYNRHLVCLRAINKAPSL
jgi:hypothetical protein